MANPLPPGVIPAISRRKVGGNEVGNYSCAVRGKRINLGTDNYMLARERARKAVNGESWENVTTSAPPVAKSFGGSDDWTGDLSDVAGPSTTPPPETPPAPEPLTLNQEEFFKGTGTGGYIPPGEPREEEDDGDTTPIDAASLEGVVDMFANGLVDLQLLGQAWIAKQWAQVQMGEVPPTGPKAICRRTGAKMWKQALKTLIPTDIPLPPWLAAPIMVAMLSLPVQAAGARPIPAEEQQPEPQQTAAA